VTRARRILVRGGLAALIGLGLHGRTAAAQVQFSVVRVSGSPAPMKVEGAVAGSVPAAAVDRSTSYTVATLTGHEKMTAQLSAPMPFGVTLAATFDVPSNWISIPNVALDATARDVVTGIDFTLGTTKTITYTLSATPAAGVVPPQSRTVTLTIVSAP